MMLESIAPGIFVGVPSKIGKNEQSGLARVFGLALNRLPELGTQTIRSANSFDVERVCTSVRDIDVVHGDPEQTGRDFAHQPFGDIERKFVGTGERARMRAEIVNRELQDGFQLLQLKLTSAQLRSIERRFVVVAQQVFVIGAAGGCCSQQMLRKDDASPKSGAVRSIAALANMVESIARSNYPGVRRRTLQVSADILEYRRIFRRQRGEVVDRLVGPSRKTRSRDIMAEDAAIHHLAEEG